MDLVVDTIQSITQGKGMDSNQETELKLFKPVRNIVPKFISYQHEAGMAV